MTAMEYLKLEHESLMALLTRVQIDLEMAEKRLQFLKQDKVQIANDLQNFSQALAILSTACCTPAK
ncbi:MAG: hypothetical protein JWQ87_5475 [Candidatus Sulfotelmatobacter sp.]|nr:hypothetical protein [Candidatus Sulfotelmatobacter sp.]